MEAADRFWNDVNLQKTNHSVDVMIAKRKHKSDVDVSSMFATISYGTPWCWGFDSFDQTKQELTIYMYNALKATVNYRRLNKLNYDRVTLNDIADRLPQNCSVERLVECKFYEWLTSSGFIAVTGPEQNPAARRLTCIDLEGSLQSRFDSAGFIKGPYNGGVSKVSVNAKNYMEKILFEGMGHDVEVVHFEDLDLLDKLTFIKMSELQLGSYHLYIVTKKECEKIKDELFDSFEETLDNPNNNRTQKKLERHIWDERIRTFPLIMRERLKRKASGMDVNYIPQISFKKQIISYERNPDLNHSIEIEIYEPEPPAYMFPSDMVNSLHPSYVPPIYSQSRRGYTNANGEFVHDLGVFSYPVEENHPNGASPLVAPRLHSSSFINNHVSPYMHHFASPVQNLLPTASISTSRFATVNHNREPFGSEAVMSQLRPPPRASSNTVDHSVMPVRHNPYTPSSSDDTSVSVPIAMGRVYNDTFHSSISNSSMNLSRDVSFLSGTAPQQNTEQMYFLLEIAADMLANTYPAPRKLSEIEVLAGNEEILRAAMFTRHFNITDGSTRELSIKNLPDCANLFRSQALEKAMKRGELADKLENLLISSDHNCMQYKFVSRIKLCDREEFLNLPRCYPRKFRLIPPETVQLIL